MKKILLSLLFLVSYSISQAQTAYVIAPEEGVKVSVKGSSTLHEWEAIASVISEVPPRLTTDLNSADGFENFGFKVGVEGLDGGRGASMNKKIRTALAATDHPNIIYISKSVALESSDEGQILKTSGVVEIAGKKMDVEVDANVEILDKNLIIKGSKALKMSDFDIEPPSAMFGQIKTRDDITVHFEFNYVAQ